MEEGISNAELNIIVDNDADGLVTTLGPSLEQKVDFDSVKYYTNGLFHNVRLKHRCKINSQNCRESVWKAFLFLLRDRIEGFFLI